MLRVLLCLLLGGFAGCVGEPFEAPTASGNGSTGAGTSTGSTSAAASSSSTGRGSSAAASTGTSSGSTGTTGGSTAASSGSSTGGQTSTGGAIAGSSSTTGGSANPLAQACTDYLAGAESVDTCEGDIGPFPTLQECETLLAVCTAQDAAILDAIGLCLQAVICNQSVETNLLICVAPLSTLSEPCHEAGSMPPDGGLEDPDAGSPGPDGGRGAGDGG